jgi:hypothetical protein
VYTLIKFLKTKAIVVRSQVETFLAGQIVKPRNKKFKKNEDAIKRVLTAHADYNRIELLQAIARNIAL